MRLSHIKHLAAKDFLLEWRSKYAIGSAMLYVASTVFITYLAFDGLISSTVWTALFWIIIVFVSVNTASRSFVFENQNTYFYYYTLSAPESIIMAKMVYNNVLMFLLSTMCALFFMLLFGGFIQNFPLFITTVILGSMGLSSLLTMTSAIAWKAKNSFSLTAILSFPLTLPLLIVLLKLTNMALGVVFWAEAAKFLLVLLLLNFITITLTYILFPYIWRD